MSQEPFPGERGAGQHWASGAQCLSRIDLKLPSYGRGPYLQPAIAHWSICTHSQANGSTPPAITGPHSARGALLLYPGQVRAVPLGGRRCPQLRLGVHARGADDEEGHLSSKKVGQSVVSREQ